jgi:hypothetical protein
MNKQNEKDFKGYKHAVNEKKRAQQNAIKNSNNKVAEEYENENVNINEDYVEDGQYLHLFY